MRRLALLAALVVLTALTASAVFAQRTGICLLNCKTDITSANPGAILYGDAQNVWVEASPFPTSCPTPGGLLWHGSGFSCSPAFSAQSILCGDTDNAAPVTAGTTVYFGSSGFSPSNPDTSAIEIPIDMHADRLFCGTGMAPGSGDTFTFTLQKNGSDETAWACTISGSSDKDCEDTAGTAVAYTASDRLSFLIESSATANDTLAHCCVRITIP